MLKWLANAIADNMADKAAELMQLSSEQHGKIQANTELSELVLRRLVAVAIKVAPPSVSTSRVVRMAGRGQECLNRFLGQEVGALA